MKKRLTTIFALLFVAMAANAQIDRSQMPESGPTPSINLGEPETFQLSNGLTVLMVENHKLPRVSISLTIDNPPHTEGNKAGVASLTASLMGNGTTSISKDAYNEEVDFMGASISLSAEGGYAQSLTEYFERVTELMADGAINPNFTQDELDKEKKILVDGLKSGEKSAAQVASRVQDVLVYGADHPYGEYLTEESVNAVTLADVKKYYQTYFVPKNAYMVVSGDIKPKKAKKIIKKYFGSWLAAGAPNISVPKAKEVQYTQIDFVDMPNAVQSELSVVSPIQLKMADEDYPAVLIANYILGGGGLSSYLNQNLREAHGYTYGSYSSASADQWSDGEFSASAKIRNAVTDSAVIEMLKEIKRIRTEPVDDEAIANAKAKYLGSFIMATENPQTTARYAINIKTKDLPEDYYKTFISRINAVTKEDVQRVAQKYFPLNNSRIVVVGKGSEVLHNLEKIELNGKTIPVFYFDKYGKKIDRPVFSKPILEGTTAKTVIEDYIKAIGGEKAVTNVKSISMLGEAEVQGMKLGLELKKTSKDQFLQNITLNGNSISKQVFNGESGYVMMQGQKRDLEGDMITKVKSEATPFPEVNLLANDDIKLKSIEAIDGRDMYVIALSETETVYFDVETGLKVKEATTQEMNGQVFTSTTTYGDYREVSGVKIPYSIKQSQGPQEFEFVMTEVTINKGVSDADFN
ncbi:Predicted Zn-dependent peptidase [Pustulibacterium marinum]|uniref:Predicted Zn-dependent peptidase n=1 Tax=Pustulibacterium marinum TaxID=1224947 RepID=A0A1I7EWD3_9FLAO|nr:pitrilysin family protein [Pustulibacterium marinum]SFU28195.1 Predicted Zn-dependent peptidase [Pustulibacterium marinum]